ncbi:MAG TPA: hypothetical protein VED24_01500 [Candidatus Acidoferrum sp.]|nr:hypothetical protein [Candidatus Acidoferrum sp.]
MSAECSGVNYALRLRRGAIEVRARPFEDSTVTIEITRIKSIELLRKSVMPPALIGAVCLSLGVILALAGEESLSILPSALRGPLQFLTIGVAFICLIILFSRWFFGSLILKPVDASPITVRLVPTGSGRRFVMLIQGQTRTTEAV